jgi:hypothetical protein
MREFNVTGLLPSGRFAFAATEPRRDGGRPDTAFYQFVDVLAQDVEFDVDEVRVHISGSTFERCVFRQDLKLAKAHRTAFAYSQSYVLFGGDELRSVYRDCVFDHVDFGIAGGGARPAGARFEGCTFNHCAFRYFDAFDADFIDCTFVGTIASARFWGHNDAYVGREPRPHVFSGNDLTRAKLRRVEYFGVDLRSSRLPSGPEYLRIDDFLAKAQQVRPMLATLSDSERKHAEVLLRIHQERWSEPFFQWRRAIGADASPLWPLLESLAQSD